MSDRAWSWRHAIAKSDLPPTTRHVLLTVSLFMNDVGGGCYPTQAQLAQATGLSERSVREHLEIAEARGWLKRTEHGFRGQRWRNHEYQAMWPDPQDVEKGAEPASGPYPEGAEPDAESCGTSFQEVRNVVPPILPDNIPATNSRAQAREGAEGFNILWGLTPEKDRPQREVAERFWDQLSPADAAAAPKAFAVYVEALRRRAKPPRLITFLKTELCDWIDCPDIDKEGDFVITSERPEWRHWMGVIRRDHGERGIQTILSLKKYIAKTRWPPDLPLDQRVTGLATML